MLYIKKISLASMVLLFLSCDNKVVSRAESDAVVDYMKDLEAENDSLQFEISDLKHYNDYLTAKLDSIQNEETYR